MGGGWVGAGAGGLDAALTCVRVFLQQLNEAHGEKIGSKSVQNQFKNRFKISSKLCCLPRRIDERAGVKGLALVCQTLSPCCSSALSQVGSTKAIHNAVDLASSYDLIMP